MQACVIELVATVSDGAAHGVYKVVNRASFSVTQYKVSGGIGHFTIVSQLRIQTSDGS